MLILKKVAITGGLASGKSTVCHLFKELGAYVVSADTIVHDLLSSDPHIIKQVVQLLGPSICNKEGIDRKKIAELVFSDPIKLRALEAILHPTVKQEITRHYEQVKDNSSYPFFVVEIPLLYETGMEGWFDIVITVSTDLSIACSRYLQQAGRKQKDFETRMKYQKTNSEKQAKADFVIFNNGDLTNLKKDVVSLFQQL